MMNTPHLSLLGQYVVPRKYSHLANPRLSRSRHCIFERLEARLPLAAASVLDTPAELPDLVVYDTAAFDTVAPSEVVLGERYDFSWIVKNEGSGGVPSTTYDDKLYISDDEVLDDSDTLVCQPRFCGRNGTPSDFYDHEWSVKVPSTQTGDRFFLFVADADNKVTEADEHNNILALPVHVIGPDLVMEEVSAPSTTILGEVEVSWRIRNNGNAAIDKWQDAILLSADMTRDRNDPLVATFDVELTQPLAPGESRLVTETVLLPSTALTEGHLLFVTDWTWHRNDGAVTEADESNNVQVSPIMLSASDLAVTDFTGEDSAVVGETIAVSWNVLNQGDAKAPTGWVDTIYLSEADSPNHYRSRRILDYSRPSSSGLDAGASYSQTTELTIPPDFAAGDYFLVLVADGAHQQPEADDDNNSRAIPITIKVPDLAISNITATNIAAIGETITVGWTVTNVGDVPAYGGWVDGVNFSSRDYPEPFPYGTFPAPGSLAPGESYRRVERVTVFKDPYNAKPEQLNLYVRANADNANGSVHGEAARENNTAFVVLPIDIPQVEIINVNVPDEVPLNEAFEVSWTVTNVGPVATSPLQADTLTLNDGPRRTLGSVTYSEPLSPGQTRWQATTVKIAEEQLYAIAKPSIQIRSGEEMAYVPITIKRPDLVISEVVVPEAVSPGEAVEVSWTVSNVGDVSTAAAWFETVDLSLDDSLLPYNARRLTRIESKEQALAPGESLTRTEAIQIPDSGALGDGYLLFHVDSNYAVQALDEANVFPVRLAITTPDLVVSDVVIPQRTSPGETIQVAWTVTNQGAASAIGEWSDTITLLEANHWRAEAGGSQYRELAVGESYQASVDLTVPHQDRLSSNWSLRVGSNSAGSPAERDLDNNIVSRDIELLRPDLSVVSVAGPDAALAGETIEITWTVANEGDSAARDEWSESIYISNTSERYSASDLLRTEPITRDKPLAVGEEYQVTRPVVLPADLNTGIWYLWVRADSEGDQSESNEQNNLRSIPIQVTAQESLPEGLPDLAITSFEFPESARRGDTIQVGWTVENRGTRAVTPRDHWSYEVAAFDSQGRRWGSLENGAISEHILPGESLPFVNEVEIPTRLPADTSTIQLTIDRRGDIEERDENNNGALTSFNLLATQLMVTDVSGPESAVPGETIDISWTIENLGEIASQEISTQVFRRFEGAGSSHELGSAIVDENLSIAPGGTITQTVPLTLPKLSPGRYTVFTLTRETENSFDPAASGEFALDVIAPDLMVTDLIAPASATAGETIEVSWTVENQGRGEVLFPFDDEVWLDGGYYGDVELDRVAGPTALAPNERYARTAEVTIPIHTSTEPRAVYISTNPELEYRQRGQIESNYRNNVISSDIVVVRPDLVVKEGNASHALELGREFEVAWTASNESEYTAFGDWLGGVYYSLDDRLDDSDLLLGTVAAEDAVPLRANTVVDQSITTSIPYTVPAAGDAFLIFAVDADDAQAETDELNNTLAFPVQVGGPDLVVTRVMSPTEVGQGHEFDVAWFVANQGSLTTATSWTDRVYLSDDPYFNYSDSWLGEVSHDIGDTFAAGAEYSRNLTVRVPNEQTPGEQYVLVVADTVGDQAEFIETNNVFAQPITILAPDLSVTEVTVPDTAYVGQSIEVSWTVSNRGPVTTATSWSDSVFLVGDSTALHTLPAGEESVAAGASYSRSAQVAIPAGVLPGADYQLRFHIDVGSELLEGMTDNNVFETPITLTAPDLQATRLTGPERAGVGEAIEVSWEVSNTGDVPATATSSDHFYLSSDEVLDEHDVPLGASAGNEALLLPDGRYSRTAGIQLPSNHPGGTQYLLVQADATNAQGEGDETNNVLAQAIDVVLPDLVVDALEAPAEASRGGRITLSWTVTNRGSAPASTPRWDRVYLSDDDQVSDDDTVYNRHRTFGVIAAGGSQVVTDTYSFSGVGEKYLIVVADDVERLFESDETNNAFAVPIFLHVPDLVPTDLQIPEITSSNAPIEIAWTVENRGQGNAYTNWRDALYLSADDRFDPDDEFLASYLYSPTVESGESYSLAVTIQLAEPVSNGYLLLVTDSNRRQLEEDETNNVLAKQFGVIITEGSGTSHAIGGQVVVVQFRTRSVSSAERAAELYTIVLSDSNRISRHSNVYKRWGRFGNPIEPGINTVQRFILMLPNDVYGELFLNIIPANVYATLSAADVPTEAVTVPIKVERADLATVAARAPLYADEAERVAVSWNVRNGSLAPTSDAWADAIYLSDDQVLSDDDVLLTEASMGVASPVASRATYTMVREIEIPDGVVGRRFLFFVANASDRHNEADAANNIRMLPIHIGAAQSRWHNFLLPHDVNNDAHVTARDALVVINELSNPRHSDDVTGRILSVADFYFDVNNDGYITAIDSLLIVNRIHDSETAEGEALWRGDGHNVPEAIDAAMKRHESASEHGPQWSTLRRSRRIDTLWQRVPKVNHSPAKSNKCKDYDEFEDLLDLLACDLTTIE